MKNKLLLFSIILVIKLITMFHFSHYMKDSDNGYLVTLPQDDEGYLSSVENYMEQGYMFYDGAHANGKMYAQRVPGQSLSYLIFRSFLNKKIAINSLLIFQVFLSSFAFLFLYILVSDSVSFLFGRVIVFILVVLEFYITYHNNIPYFAESINASLCIISLLLFKNYLKSFDKKVILFLGITVGLTFFFKVASIVFVFIMGTYLFIFLVRRMNNLKIVFNHLFLFCLPFIIMETMWIARNEMVADKLIFTQEIKGAPISINKYDNSKFLATVNLCKAVGGDCVYWNPNSMINWFNSDSYLTKMGFERPSDDILPKILFTKELTIDKLKLARQHLWDENENEGIEIINDFKMNVIKNHPFHCHVTSRLLFAKNLLFQTPTYYFPYSFNEANLLEKFIKIIALFLHYLILVVPFIYLPIYLKNYSSFKDNIINLCYTISFSYVLFYAFIFRTSEFRFNLMSYICSFIVTLFIFSRILNNYKVIFMKDKGK